MTFPTGRVVRVRPEAVVVSTLSGLRELPMGSSTETAALGDLVTWANGHVHVVARNRSARDLEAQDWWRLHRIWPNLVRRCELMSELRAWFRDRGFVELETPVMARSPGLEVHLRAIEARSTRESRWLITSPEYYLKRVLSAGAERVFYLGRAFRDDEDGHLHHGEFTMLEWYRAGEPPRAIQDDVEAIVALATGQPRAWTRFTVAEALERFGRPSQDPDDVITQLVERIEPALAPLGATWLERWPIALASLARPCDDDPTVAERFEAYVDGVELCNGFGELTDPVEQRARCERDAAERARLGLPAYPIDASFLDALEAGLPPCSGVALGVDRLIMLATGARHLDDVVAIPPRLG